MGAITVLKKTDGFWLEFKSDSGKCALVPITKIMPLPGIATRAVLSTCEECAAVKFDDKQLRIYVRSPELNVRPTAGNSVQRCPQAQRGTTK